MGPHFLIVIGFRDTLIDMAFVGEVPPPPDYYKVFSEPTSLEAPKIPDGFKANQQYNGLFTPPINATEMAISSVAATVDGATIRGRLKEILRSVVNESLNPFIPPGTGTGAGAGAGAGASSGRMDVAQVRARMDELLMEAHAILKGIKRRQACSKLCNELELQLSQLKEAEADLQNALTQAKGLV
jgi:hypothetical protein